MQAIKKIDKLGRVVLPVDYRKALSLKVDDEVCLEIAGKAITLRAVCNVCRLCGGDAEIESSVSVCAACIQKIRGMDD